MKAISVLALDVGTRNLGVCWVSADNHRQPKEWMRVDLLSHARNKSPSTEDIVRLTVHWVRNHATWFNECDAIVLEKQMRTPFIVMNSVISALHLEKVHIVHPLRVGKFWGLPTTRAAKKKAAIATVAQNGAVIPHDTHDKYDDMADAYLMAVYQLCQMNAVDKVEEYNAEFN